MVVTGCFGSTALSGGGLEETCKRNGGSDRWAKSEAVTGTRVFRSKVVTDVHRENPGPG